MSQIGAKLLERFSNDFAQLLENEYNYNVIVKVGEQNFRLHSLILYQRSSFFRQELSNATKNNNIIKIILPQVSVESFKILIKYIYTGIIPLENSEPSILFDLLVSSNKLGLEELVEYIQSYLIDNKASWLRLKFTQVYCTSFQVDNFKALQTFCTDIIAKHPNLVFDSEDFTSIQEKALVTLLERDDLQIEESVIWDKVIHWGKSNTPDLPPDFKDWTNENFLNLKTTLKNSIPLIRFFQMSGKDIIVKVKPYQQILGLNLWNDIITRTMAPDEPVYSIILPARKKIQVQLPARETIPDQLPDQGVTFIDPSSNIINEHHVAEISSWIDRHLSSYDITKIPYKFKLLFRGSRDEFTCESFHRLCDNIPCTVAVIKVNGTNEILGGYNPLTWSSENKCLSTADSFIFSLKTQSLTNSILSRIINTYNTYLPNSILSRVINTSVAIGCYSQRGPIFGGLFYMINSSKIWSYSHSAYNYEKPLRDTNHSLLVDEFEVFQVIKN